MKINRVAIIIQLEEKKKILLSRRDERLRQWKTDVEDCMLGDDALIRDAIAEYREAFHKFTVAPWPLPIDDPRVSDCRRPPSSIHVPMPNVPDVYSPRQVGIIDRALVILRANEQETVTLPVWIEQLL